jgi:GT2 family glycosyltransferase
MKANNTIDFLICNYNCEDVILDCINSILNLNIDNINILIYDNNSSDNSINNILQLNCNNIQIFYGKENIGYGKAINYLCNHSKSKFIFILNPDTILKFNKSDFIELLNNFKDRRTIIGFKIKDKNGNTNNFIHSLPGLYWLIGSLLRKAFPILFNPLYHISFKCKKNILTQDKFLIPGCSLLMNRDLFFEIGMFNSNYFLYFEDTELLYKAHIKGIEIKQSDLLIFHDAGHSFKKSTNVIKVEEYKSALIFFKNNYSNLYYIISFIILKLISICSLFNPSNYFNNKYKYFLSLLKL